MNLFYDFNIESYDRSFDLCYSIGGKIKSKYYPGEYSSFYNVDMFSLFWDFVVTKSQCNQLTFYSLVIDEIERKISL